MTRAPRRGRKRVVFFYPSTGLDLPGVSVFLPLSVMLPAAALEFEGYTVTIVDQRVDRRWRTRLADEARSRPAFVGISAMTGAQIRWALRGAEIVRRSAPDVPIVWGGVHATILPEQTLADDRVDVVVAGRGEKAAVDLADAYVHDVDRKRDLKSIVRDPDPGEQAGEEFRQPALAYGRLPWQKYLTPVTDGAEGLAHVTSRGCPHRCGYCYNQSVNNSTWRGQSPHAVVESFQRIRSLGCRGILLFDDNFFADRERVEKIAELLTRRRTDFKIKADCRADYILEFDDRFMRLLKRAGFAMLYIGAESGSDRVLDMMGKQLTVRELIDANRRLSKAEIRPHYSFMAGVPGETEEDIQATIGLMNRLKNDHPGAYISPVKGYMPYPGTTMYRKAVDGGFDPPNTLENWSRLDWNSAPRPWLTQRQALLVEKATYVTFGLDDQLLSNSGLAGYPLMSVILRTYASICRMRCRKKRLGLMPELPVLRMAKRIINATGWPERIYGRYC
jgi:radical SAM superfamily enzyme YgiQ (UPF0313 family)